MTGVGKGVKGGDDGEAEGLVVQHLEKAHAVREVSPDRSRRHHRVWIISFTLTLQQAKKKQLPSLRSAAAPPPSAQDR